MELILKFIVLCVCVIVIVCVIGLAILWVLNPVIEKFEKKEYDMMGAD